jgi:hypothetical protein
MADKTEAEYLKEMTELSNGNGSNEEEAHIAADDLLCELLRHLGYERLIDAYDKVGKWYA